MAKIYSEIDRELIRKHIQNDTLRPCGPVPTLTESELDKTPVVVAQMGAEPYIKALEEGAEIILGGERICEDYADIP